MVKVSWIRGQRKALCSNLAHVILVSRTKFDSERASNGDRQRWGRLVISGIEAYGKLLEAAQLDDLSDRVERLENGSEDSGAVEKSVERQDTVS
jgi:hypothetical protein